MDDGGWTVSDGGRIWTAIGAKGGERGEGLDRDRREKGEGHERGGWVDGRGTTDDG